MDIHDKIDQDIKKLKQLQNTTPDIFGEIKKPRPCDNMATFQIEDCKTCSRPCDEPQVVKLTGEENDNES